MKKILYFITLLLVFMLPLCSMAENGKVCRVEGGSVQAEVTNSPMPKSVNGSWEYEVSFVLMNSSPNFVNATYVIRDNNNKEYSKSRVLVAPQKESETKKAIVRTNSKASTFVVDVVGADCKKE